MAHMIAMQDHHYSEPYFSQTQSTASLDFAPGNMFQDMSQIRPGFTLAMLKRSNDRLKLGGGGYCATMPPAAKSAKGHLSILQQWHVL